MRSTPKRRALIIAAFEGRQHGIRRRIEFVDPTLASVGRFTGHWKGRMWLLTLGGGPFPDQSGSLWSGYGSSQSRRNVWLHGLVMLELLSFAVPGRPKLAMAAEFHASQVAAAVTRS
jgi:hypothetical protein